MSHAHEFTATFLFPKEVSLEAVQDALAPILDFENEDARVTEQNGHLEYDGISLDASWVKKDKIAYRAINLTTFGEVSEGYFEVIQSALPAINALAAQPGHATLYNTDNDPDEMDGYVVVWGPTPEDRVRECFHVLISRAPTGRLSYYGISGASPEDEAMIAEVFAEVEEGIRAISQETQKRIQALTDNAIDSYKDRATRSPR